jgi:D-beta-D-heptose 7-phosphate kinase/D-beta-D-heptose 1-phosphate adenosyltransferase
LFKYARSLGDKLIVGINSDSSVKQLKGDSRPYNNEQARKEFLEELKCIDSVIIYSDKRVTNCLEQVHPDIWVKGGDYTLNTLDKDEYAMAQKLGIEIVIFPFVKGYSTTSILSNKK